MAVDVENVFKATTMSTSILLAPSGSGFYVPAYQRAYAWSNDQIRRLFEDLSHGLARLFSEKDESNAITFIGSIILIKDHKHETINPLVKGQVPQGVHLVIDGQQRLTTIVLTFAELYSEIASLKKFIPNDDSELAMWFTQQHAQVGTRLRSTFEIDMSVGSGVERYYPKIVRAFQDAWSYQSGKASYQSAVASYLFRRIHEVHDVTQRSLGGSDDSIKKPLSTIRKCIRSIDPFASTPERSVAEEMPSCREIADKSDIAMRLFGSTWPDDLDALLRSSAPTTKEARLQHLLRLLAFSRYALDHVALTVVQPVSEDVAFDVFEALNTTGEPLNAVETFKPRVISMETLPDYEGSSSKYWFELVESYLQNGTSPTQRQRLVNDLLIPHRLSETGDKLTKHLGDQRRYLKGRFEESSQGPTENTGESEEDKRHRQREFVRSLGGLSYFLANVWTLRTPGIYSEYRFPILDGHVEIAEQAAVCLSVLRESNHDIAVAPIYRYYSGLLNTSSGGPVLKPATSDKVLDFYDAVRAIAAFILFWRCTRSGTAGIDARFRTLMKGRTNEESPCTLARGDQSANDSLDVSSLRSCLRRFLAEADSREIRNREDFIKYASTTDFYDNMSTWLIRFALMAAAHDSVADSAAPGLPIRGALGCSPTLTWKEWVKEPTVEHISPQSHPVDQGYDEKIYEDAGMIHRLGNLTLLPSAINSSIGDRPWPEKRAIYQAVSAETIEESVAGLAKLGIETASTKELFAKTGYIVHARTLARHTDEEWNAEFVEQRGRRLAGLCWDVCAPWLAYESEVEN